jgi:hypothetical protein
MLQKPDERTKTLWRQIKEEYEHPKRHNYYYKVIVVVITIVMLVILWF